MKDRFNIEMEDISPFPIERSDDYEVWEPISHEEVIKMLEEAPESKRKVFLGVVRNGSAFLFGNQYYRIRAD